MKQLICILLLMLVIPEAVAEESLWTEDIFPYHDQSIQVHAIIDDEFPMPLQRIREQQKRGATILLSSRIAGDVEELYSCVYEMDNGVLTVKKEHSLVA